MRVHGHHDAVGTDYDSVGLFQQRDNATPATRRPPEPEELGTRVGSTNPPIAQELVAALTELVRRLP